MIKMITTYLANLRNKSTFVPQNEISDDVHTVNGSYKVDTIQIDINLCINGQAVFGKNVQAQKSILVNGQFIACQSRLLSDLTVNGSSAIEDTQIHGVAIFRGNLKATSTTFFNKLDILSSLTEFENCKTQGIAFKKLPIETIVQRLKLSKHTEVQGDILFEAGNGEVICDATSKIHGHIIGGTLSTKNNIFY